MIIKGKIIELINRNDIADKQTIEISDSIIKKIDLLNCEINEVLSIRNCIVYEFDIHSCWLRKGLLFGNNQVHSYVDYQMGGHNEEIICFRRNIFFSFVNFFDCHFEHQIELYENIFTKGTNLLGNQNEGFVNTFDKTPVIYGNIGALNADGVGFD